MFNIMKKIRLFFALTAVFVLAMTFPVSSEGALPSSGSVDCLYGITWEKPHFKKNKIYITLKNDTAVFQAIELKAYFVDESDEKLGEGFFHVGVAPGKSVRAFAKLENVKENLSKAIKIVWVKK